MMTDLFVKIKNLLTNHVELLNKHSLGDTHVADAEAIIEELNILLRSDELKQVEQHVEDAERRQLSEELAEEIIGGKYCIGGNCED